MSSNHLDLRSVWKSLVASVYVGAIEKFPFRFRLSVQAFPLNGMETFMQRLQAYRFTIRSV